MKKLIIVFLISSLGSVLVNAQSDTLSSKGSFYLSAGLSVSNTYSSTFAASSYPSVEFGYMRDNFTIGLVTGRSSLSGFSNDALPNYWYEVKTALSFPVGKFNGYGLIGIGNYISTSQLFIEYGVGFSYTLSDKIDVFGQVSNWDRVYYVTPGLVYKF